MNAIYDLPINLRYIHERVPPLIDLHCLCERWWDYNLAVGWLVGSHETLLVKTLGEGSSRLSLLPWEQGEIQAVGCCWCIKHVFMYLLCWNLQVLNVCICLHSSGLTNICILHRAFLKLSNPQSCNVEEFHGGRLVSCYILCLETWDIPGGQSGELYKHATTYYVWILISGAWHSTMYSK